MFHRVIEIFQSKKKAIPFRNSDVIISYRPCWVTCRCTRTGIVTWYRCSPSLTEKPQRSPELRHVECIHLWKGILPQRNSPLPLMTCTVPGPLASYSHPFTRLQAYPTRGDVIYTHASLPTFVPVFIVLNLLSYFFQKQESIE